MEAAAYDYFRRIDELGGMVEAIKQNFPQREIADAAFSYQQEVDAGERIVVGVNELQLEDDDEQTPILQDRPGARAQAGRPPAGGPRAPRRGRGRGDPGDAARGRRDRPEPDVPDPRLRPRARPPRARWSQALQEVFGTYSETPVF